MPTTLQLRRGTTAENAAFTGAEGELTVDTQTNSLNVHDGSTVGGNAITGGGASVLTTKGDVATFSTVDARLPVGSDDQVLTADSAEATGVKWATPSAGAGMPAIIRGTAFGAGYAQVPDNIAKFGGDSTRTTANQVLYVPCMFYTPTLITNLGVQVGLADAGSTDTRVGIFSQDATTGLPGTLVAGTGAIDVSATGVRVDALGSPVTVHGFYWIGVKSDSVTLEIADIAPNNAEIFLNPMGLSNTAGTMRFPKTDGVIGAFTSNPTYDGNSGDNSSLWIPCYT